MFAIIEAYKQGLFQAKYWKTNIVAGTIVAVAALPLAMAFAIASGVKPEQGIYTAIIAGLVVGIFGGSRVQIAGPTGAFVIVLASITAKYGVSGLQIATIFAGLMLCLMGVFKWGKTIKFIPYPVIVGFTSGIGVIIFVGEWKDFLGLPVAFPIDAPFFEKVTHLLKAMPHLDYKTACLSCVSLFLLIYLPRIIKTVPSPLLAMLFATGLQSYFNDPNIATIGSVFGVIPQALPSFTVPDFSTLSMTALLGPAFAIALLGAIESLLSATAADAMTRTKHSPNKELIGQGLANVIAPFFGGFASTGAIARTVTNIRNGGNSPIAAIVHAGVLILTILLLAPYAVHIPFAVLAAILCVVAFNMANIPEFIHIVKRAPWYDVIVLLATFCLTVLTDLVFAVMSGVILAGLFFMLRIHQTKGIRFSSLKALKKEHRASNVAVSFPTDDGIIYEVSGPLFFGVAERIEQALTVTHTMPKYVIFCLKHVPFMDMTGLTTFSKIVEDYTKNGVKTYVCGANHKVSKKIDTLGILKMVHMNTIFPSMSHTLEFRESERD